MSFARETSVAGSVSEKAVAEAWLERRVFAPGAVVLTLARLFQLLLDGAAAGTAWRWRLRSRIRLARLSLGLALERGLPLATLGSGLAQAGRREPLEVIGPQAVA